MKWKPTPITKFYEAVGSVADGRVKIIDNKNAQVYSSSGNKYYDITFDPDTNSIMSNDNSTFYKGYLGYPAISFLMVIGKLSYSDDVGKIMSGIKWKDINQKYKNDFEKALEFIMSSKTISERETVDNFVNKVSEEFEKLSLNKLGARTKPPEGY